MSLVTHIESLIARIAQEFNDARATAENLVSLSATDRSNLVMVVNELKAAVLSVTTTGNNQITASTTYSPNKIVSLLDTPRADILGRAGAAYDTLVKIQQSLQNGITDLNALLTAVNLQMRYGAAQTPAVAEQLQVRTSIGTVMAVDVSSIDMDFVVIFDGALTW